jgi:hypothetical protein
MNDPLRLLNGSLGDKACSPGIDLAYFSLFLTYFLSHNTIQSISSAIFILLDE